MADPYNNHLTSTSTSNYRTLLGTSRWRRSQIYEEAHWAVDNLYRLVEMSGGVRLQLFWTVAGRVSATPLDAERSPINVRKTSSSPKDCFS